MLNRSKGLFLGLPDLMKVQVIDTVWHKTHAGPLPEEGKKYFRTLVSYEVIAEGYLYGSLLDSIGVNRETPDTYYDGFGFANVFSIETSTPYFQEYVGKHVIVLPLTEEEATRVIRDDKNVGRLTDLIELNKVLERINHVVCEGLWFTVNNDQAALPGYTANPQIIKYNFYMDVAYVSIYAFEEALKGIYGNKASFHIVEKDEPQLQGSLVNIDLTITK
ncbi:hypothetical protein [Pseudomonas phage PA1C]|nr:hypothetical protein [Pseudomonas phage PA1C]